MGNTEISFLLREIFQNFTQFILKKGTRIRLAVKNHRISEAAAVTPLLMAANIAPLIYGLMYR